MPGLSVYTENNLLNTFRGLYYAESTIYVSLHTANPGATGLSEVAGGTYARVLVTWGAPSNGSMTNTNTVTINVPASTTISYFGLWDGISGASPGNFIGGAALSASQTFGSAGTASFAPGQLSFALTA